MTRDQLAWYVAIGLTVVPMLWIACRAWVETLEIPEYEPPPEPEQLDDVA